MDALAKLEEDFNTDVHRIHLSKITLLSVACGEYSSPIWQSLPPLPLYTPRESIAEATTTVTDLLQPDL